MEMEQKPIDWTEFRNALRKGDEFQLVTDYGAKYYRCRIKSITEKNIVFIDRNDDTIYLSPDIIKEIKPSRSSGQGW